MSDKLQAEGYEQYKRRSKVLGWIIPVLLIGQAVVMYFDGHGLLEIYRPVMYAIFGIVIAYQIYYLYKYRHEDDNKYKLAVILLILSGLAVLVLTT